MSIAASSTQNLGIFSVHYPSIERALRTAKHRTVVGEYILLDGKDDLKFPFQGKFSVKFFAAKKMAEIGRWHICVASRLGLNASDCLNENRTLRILSGSKGILHPFLKKQDGIFEYKLTKLFNLGSLGHLIKKGEKLTPEEKSWVAFSIVCALSEVHQSSIIHRDIKPDNILVHRKKDRQLEVKLIDFGFGCLKTDPLLELEKIRGTINYLPPEFWNAQPKSFPADLPRDAWAFGCLLYFLEFDELFVERGIKKGKDVTNLVWKPLYQEKRSFGLFHQEIRDLLDKNPTTRRTILSAKESMEKIFIRTFPTLARASSPAKENPLTPFAQFIKGAREIVLRSNKTLYDHILSFLEVPA